MCEKHKPSSRQVIITVGGGCADVLFKPAGIAVTLFDYDVNGVEKTAKDPDGERCIVGHWDARLKVISNEHWPIIQQAKTDITCRCTRQWKCPSCGRLIDLSYEDLAETGSPMCSDCDLEMEML
jgi:hypothetical protein